MHVADGEDDFGRVKLGPLLLEPALLAQVKEELSAGAVVEHKVQLVLRLEGHVHADNEWVPHVPQDAALGLRVLHLIPLDDVVLSKDFQRVCLVGLDFSHEEHLAWNTR